MADVDGYALLDAGGGARLERFGRRLVDRPAPGATFLPRDPAAWAHADLRFRPGPGWTGEALEPWTIGIGGLTLELRPTETGQVGLFPEHAAMWPWLRDRVRASEPPETLHLFGYTGATTLVLARAGARVAHVDASRPTVGWARRNAVLSGLADAPIRWLVDDAAAFVDREVRRERRYQGVVLDPPAWGHGAGRAWRLDQDLAALLRAIARLLAPRAFVMLTAHSVGWGPERLADALRTAMPGGPVEAGGLDLRAASGAVLPLGAFARVIIGP